jgi:starch synthase
MNVVLVSSELRPWSKTGGLGDVVASLAEGYARAGHQVLTVSPRYRGVAPEAEFTGAVGRVPLAGVEQRAGLYRLAHGGVQHVFVDSPLYDREGVYGDASGTYGDNHLRFALLCQMALHAARDLAREEVVFHCHDWQAALLPAYLKAYWRPCGQFERAGTVLTLHNPAHQGRLPAGLFGELELPARWFALGGYEFHGDLALLKGGIVHADQLTTVSPTFAREIVTPGGGFGLEPVLLSRAVDLTGILNGVDEAEWSPETDVHLAAPYDAADLSGKAECKEALQRSLGLPVDPTAPVLGSVGRLDPQKGIELIIDSVAWLADQGAQVIVLGSAAAAHRAFEVRLRELEHHYPRNVRAWIGYSDAVAHQVVAGADLFLMPSLFEPCGLTQMYSQRYGTPPVVRRTGGLADSVEEFDAWSRTGTGFFFDRPTGAGLREALWRALELYRRHPAEFEALRRRGMARDFSWDRAIATYTLVCERALALRSG